MRRMRPLGSGPAPGPNQDSHFVTPAGISHAPAGRRPNPRGKTAARIVLERLTATGRRLVAGAEVPHESLHRYTAIDKREAIGLALQVTLGILGEAIPIGKAEVPRAREIARYRALISARDAVHIAVMERYGSRSILSFESAFHR
jgi:predicted nucleic acid-binding protein